MREFFHVVTVEEAGARAASLSPAGAVGTERVPLAGAAGRVLARDLVAPHDLPGFRRSTVDGFAVRAASTFGASEGAPALLDVAGEVRMGEAARAPLRPGEAMRIPTGAMLPEGADAVVMVEQTEALDDSAVEAHRAVVPGENVVAADEDARAGQVVLSAGTRLRPQEAGLLAAFGVVEADVYRRPVVAVLSTGDEIVPPEATPGPGQVRDVNATTLCALVAAAGGIPLPLGVAPDEEGPLRAAIGEGFERADALLVSGGSSVGARDLVVDVLRSFPRAEVLFHGVAMKPGKPTLLGRACGKAVWGLPGHVASAMVVFRVLVGPFVERLGGSGAGRRVGSALSARLSRSVASAQGRTDFVRVSVEERDGLTWAVPVMGRSGLLRTMVGAHGLVRIDAGVEGLAAGAPVTVLLF